MTEKTTTPKAAKTTRKTAAKKSAVKKTATKTAAVKSAPKAYSASGDSKANLVIVESPAKARTIEKYLGKDFKVLASVGHVIDLPPSSLGVDIEHDFKPEYVTIRGKKQVLDALKKAAASAKTIYLATDPDREGEAIAWHVANYLDAKNKTVYRATFNEITKQAIQAAIANPGQINDNLCMAQQTRRILDRLVGYQISPLLWRNVQRGLSAGRVQSVAVRLLCERETEIEAFKSEEYWSVEAQAEAKNPPPFTLRLSKIDGDKAAIPNAEAANSIVEQVKDQPFIIGAVNKKQVRRNPQPPFITSSLQQEAARKLRMSPNQTMAVAQGLYEGVTLGDEAVGLITYMRTDSTRIAESALEGIRSFISEKYGAQYLPEKPNTYATKKGAQDAHEAVRPTLLDRPPESLAQYLDENQMALYRLIWERFVASQMMPAQLEQTTIEVPLLNAKYTFIATGSVVTFPGFLAVYEEGHDQDDTEKSTNEETAARLPIVAEGEQLSIKEFLPEQHFTQPPPRFSMSSLIKELEKRGIGRPSTYAAILTTVQEKGYAERIKGYFKPTHLGRIVTEILIASFPEILDVAFTAKMEQELDDVEEGEREWLEVMREFYGAFQQRLEEATKSMRSPRGEEEPTDIVCENCGSPMVVKWGRNGRFIACTNYPECKTTKPYVTDGDGKAVAEKMPETEEVCDKCGSPMLVKNGRHGVFLACSKYPECKNTRPIKEVQDGKVVPAEALPATDEVCSKCSSPMAVKSGRKGLFLACTSYPKCKNTRPIAEVKDGKAIAQDVPETDEVCDKCGAPMVIKNSRRGAISGLLRLSQMQECKATGRRSRRKSPRRQGQSQLKRIRSAKTAASQCSCVQAAMATSSVAQAIQNARQP